MNGSSNRLFVLLVDDNPDDRALVERELKQHIAGVHVEHAADLRSLQAAITRGQFDVVVTDYLLRWSTGTEVLREIKKYFPQTPVIMFTGSGSEEIAVSAMKEGLDDYITKTIKHYPRVPYAVLACVDRSRQREELARALEREKLSKLRLEIALASASMGTWQLDFATGRLSYSADMGPMFGKATGFSHASLEHLLADIHPDDRPAFNVAWESAIGGLRDFSVQFRTCAPDSSMRWISSSGRVVRNGGDAPTLMIGTARDVTADVLAREQTLRQQQELQAIFDVLPVGVAISRDARADHITLTNYFAELFGVDPHTNISATGVDASTRPFRSYANGVEVEPADLPMQRAARLGQDVRGEELDVALSDGRLVSLLVNASPLRNNQGDVVGAVGALMDVTSLKNVQRELEAANRQKTQFLSVLSHELRNPMAAIGYAVELLRHFGSPDVIGKARSAIERQAAHMARLLDDLLDLSRITANKIEIDRKQLDLRRVIELGYESARPLIEPHGHQVTINLPPEPIFVRGDEVRLTQVITNILGNAAKFTPPPGKITISARQEAGRAAIHIADNGIGIEKDQLGRVFDMFYQGESKARGGISGLGIGLAIARELIVLHGGSVKALSDGRGHGTRFELEFPLSTPVASEQRGKAFSLADAGHGRLLVADDNADAADALSEVLRIEGYTVVTAYDGRSAMEAAEVSRPDAAILDIGMPLATGNDVARWIRKRPWGEHLTLIAVTGWGQEADRMETRNSGFDVHLVKPVAVAEIIGLIAKSLSERRAR